MTVEDLLQALDRKDNTEAYQALLSLERLSSDSNVLYPYTEKFAEMTESDRNVVRVRGVRLFCSQANGDSGSMIDRFRSGPVCTAGRQADHREADAGCAAGCGQIQTGAAG